MAYAGVQLIDAAGAALDLDGLHDAWAAALAGNVAMGPLRWVMRPKQFVALLRQLPQNRLGPDPPDPQPVVPLPPRGQRRDTTIYACPACASSGAPTATSFLASALLSLATRR